jgi:bacillithiol system protein YtxJ
MEWAFSVDQLDAHFLDLIAHRNISNKIATLFSVEHESPQLIVISKGVVIYHDSHQAIDLGEVNRTLDISVV